LITKKAVLQDRRGKGEEFVRKGGRTEKRKGERGPERKEKGIKCRPKGKSMGGPLITV